jgi:hypothetical protein
MVVGRFVVKLYSGDAYRTSDVDLVDTLRPEDTSLILADAACNTDIGAYIWPSRSPEEGAKPSG